jgi:Fe-S-cluster-containing dehydrogenase component/formate-dependent nitrite reductase membrane component NrfD
MRYGFIIDNRKCIGCHACTTACKAEHDVPVGVFRTWVKQVEKGEFPHTRRLFSVMRCNHCTDAPCVEICPVEALYFRDDGIVDFDKDRCIGCKSCMQACPYDALYIDPENHTAAKCNYCAHRIDVGLEPACVNVCPEHAIISGDMDDPDSEIAVLLGREQVSVRKAAKGTVPNLFYIDGDEASLNPVATERQSNYFWNEQSRGVGHFAKQTEKLAFSGDSVITELLEKQGQGVAAGDLAKGTPTKSIELLMGQPRRVYDAPVKGVLWGWEVPAYIVTKAIASGAVLVAVLASFFFPDVLSMSSSWWAIGLGIGFIGATGGLLVKDLDRPDRFLNVLLRPQWKSWLVRGGYTISIFGALLALMAVLKFMGWAEGLMPVLEGAVFLVSLLTSVYTAFLFAQAKGRDFWQSPTLALHMLVHSFMAGAAVFILVDFIQPGSPEWLGYLRNTLLISVVLNILLMVLEFVTTHPTEEARLTVEMILKGRYRNRFWVGAILVGNILPLVLLVSGASLPVCAAAGVLTLIGVYITERIWVEAPQRIQLV